jgi:DMSO/TMAO reductase YedYZ molybdopterin-dependent catalytic subunit
MRSPNKSPNVKRDARARSRRAFLTMGAAAAAGYGGWAWLRSRPEDGSLEWPLRGMLRNNERVAEAYFSDGHLAPSFDLASVAANTRLNGDVGLGSPIDTERWVLNVKSPDSAEARQITMAQIRALPRVEQITQLNCIEGWTVIVHWTGARLADFTAKYAAQGGRAKYVGMQTPDHEYFVGLDIASALHPQTLLCYEMNGAALTNAHGAPLRLVIPVKYGVKNIKRIGTVTYTNDRPEDYWANDGYDWYAGL